MRLRYFLAWIVLILFASAGAKGADLDIIPFTTPHYADLAGANLYDLAGYSGLSLYAQGWLTPAYYGYGGNSGYSRHFPYLYFYEQSVREAEESRRAAQELETSLAREGKLTGPLEVGAFPSDFVPRSPLRQELTLDGRAVVPSPSGAPLVVGSGEHTLQIGSARATPAN